MQNSLSLSSIPGERLLIEPCKVRLIGAPAAAYVVIEATLTDRGGQVWSSRGVYTADIDGIVDTEIHASLGGTYRGVDAEGLFWSMLPITLEAMGDISQHPPKVESARRTPDFDVFDASYDIRVAPIDIDLRARVIGHLADPDLKTPEAKHVVHFMADGITRTQVRDNGLIGTFFEPAGDGPHPAVLMITGSDGGCYEARAALLASKGVATLALAHFRYPGCSDILRDIPLEYFRDAMGWLSARCNCERVGLHGTSLGGAGVLLIASVFPEKVSAVVADVPSGIVVSGFDFSTMESVPCWLLNGKPLPYVEFQNYAGRDSELQAGALEMRQNFHNALIDTEYEDPRWIKVENIDCPIMLTSGTADTLWASSSACARIARRLESKGWDKELTWLNYEGAGHMVGIPMLVKGRADELERNELDMIMAIGGNPRDNAHAQADCFARMISFLKANA